MPPNEDQNQNQNQEINIAEVANSPFDIKSQLPPEAYNPVMPSTLPNKPGHKKMIISILVIFLIVVGVSVVFYLKLFQKSSSLYFYSNMSGSSLIVEDSAQKTITKFTPQNQLNLVGVLDRNSQATLVGEQSPNLFFNNEYIVNNTGLVNKLPSSVVSPQFLGSNKSIQEPAIQQFLGYSGDLIENHCQYNAANYIEACNIYDVNLKSGSFKTIGSFPVPNLGSSQQNALPPYDLYILGVSPKNIVYVIYVTSLNNTAATVDLEEINVSDDRVVKIVKINNIDSSMVGLDHADTYAIPFSLSSNFGWFAYTSQNGENGIYITNLTSGKTKKLSVPQSSSSFPSISGVQDVALSPDGSKVAFVNIKGNLAPGAADTEYIAYINVADGNVTKIYTSSDDAYKLMGWLRNNTIAFLSYAGKPNFFNYFSLKTSKISQIPAPKGYFLVVHDLSYGSMNYLAQVQRLY